MTRAGRDEQAPPRRPTAADGVVVVDKPAGWTSHDVVGRMRRLAGTRKVGHAGTLDPMATGVLVIGIGRATRLLTYVTGADKEYLATIRLGASTTTDDAEGEVLSAPGAPGLDLDRVRAALVPLTGDLLQVPSAVSAIKVDGQRAYARVRAGQDVQLAARPVHVAEFELLAAREVDTWTDLDVRVVCSSGTYVRALARDLGAALGTGGHLTALRRTRVAGFTLAQARTLDELAAQADAAPDGRLPVLAPGAAAGAVMPVRALSAQEARELSFGRAVAAGSVDVAGETPATGTELAAPPMAGLGPDGTLVAVLTVRGGLARPVLVMAPAG
ncbi:tRNA pseudouridine(55) synthase TruB [Cellulomonas citrea]|uniref:tRNA pseudouridine(55) synthase TruB n=1 Tax=Cellulomonas citrea TaxID=1909423 RepID=UPI001359BD9D|nr:tRNA pseudouridine(55) synthase TruB [Cellulomonas citrea]